MMRTRFVLAAIAVGSTCLPAMAADLIVSPEPEAMLPSSYSWSGAYIGGSVGFVTADSDVDNILFEGVASGIAPFTIDSSGWLAGVTVGVNQQWDNIVVGIEGDVSWASAEGTHEDPIAGFSITTRLQALATLRGRIGFAADQLLLYATAGLAYGSVEAELADDYPLPLGTVVTTDTQGLFGWTAGVGAELAVADNISLKAEGLYYDLGSATYTFNEGPGGWNPATADAATTGWIARVGANFHF